jgi:hypothetical protein
VKMIKVVSRSKQVVARATVLPFLVRIGIAVSGQVAV